MGANIFFSISPGSDHSESILNFSDFSQRVGGEAEGEIKNHLFKFYHFFSADLAGYPAITGYPVAGYLGRISGRISGIR